MAEGNGDRPRGLGDSWNGDARDNKDEQAEHGHTPTAAVDQDAAMDPLKREQQGSGGQPERGTPPAGYQQPGGTPGFAGPGSYPAPGFAPQTKTAMGGGAKVIAWLLLLVCLLAIVGSIGTWASSTVSLGGTLGSVHQSMNGWGDVSGSLPPSAHGSQSANLPHDGIVVTVFAVIVGILAIVRAFGKAAVVTGIAAVVSGLIAVVVSIWCIHAYSNKNDQLQQQVGDAATATLSSGWGVWLVLICGILLALLGIAGIVKRR